jgi:predicted Mrr-cat superfamily restriction endonuclease
MAVWILHVTESRVSADEPLLHLPFDDVPDLSQAHSLQDVRRALAKLTPGTPPETLARQAERYWNYIFVLHAEDIIAIPLPSQNCVAYAEATGPITYDTEKKRYTVPVRWFAKRTPMAKFRLSARARMFEPDGRVLIALKDAQEKNAIRNQLPLKGNRFARWKWIIVMVIAIKAFYFILHMLRNDGVNL